MYRCLVTRGSPHSFLMAATNCHSSIRRVRLNSSTRRSATMGHFFNESYFTGRLTRPFVPVSFDTPLLLHTPIYAPSGWSQRGGGGELLSCHRSDCMTASETGDGRTRAGVVDAHWCSVVCRPMGGGNRGQPCRPLCVYVCVCVGETELAATTIQSNTSYRKHTLVSPLPLPLPLPGSSVPSWRVCMAV